MAFSSDKSLQSNQISISIDYPKPDSPDFLDALSLDRKRISDAINTKEGALYSLKEQATFQSYYTINKPYTFRNVYRTVVNCGALPALAGVTKQIPHGIPFNNQFRTTRIYGSSTDPVALQYISLPYPAVNPANVVEVYLDATFINIITGIPRNNFTVTSIVIEYTKNPEV